MNQDDLLTRGSGVSRRRALTLLGAAGASGAAAACGGAKTSSNADSATTTAPSTSTSTAQAGGSAGTATTATSTTAPSATVDCVLTPEATEGPYYLDIAKVRSDITEGKDGAPLTLRITVLDAATCQPIKDAAVDIWHCDAGGIYSGFGSASTGGGPGGGASGRTDNLVFLRGTQLTDAAGLVTFQTIYPGWYRGRAVHVHMKVHVDNSVKHTGQLFFDDGLTDTVYQRAPYNARGARDQRNTDDGIFGSAGGASAIAAVTGNGTYTGRITVGIKQ